MNTFQLWEKMIKSKTYSKDVAIRRVTTIGPLLTDTEFEDLIDLISVTYA